MSAQPHSRSRVPGLIDAAALSVGDIPLSISGSVFWVDATRLSLNHEDAVSTWSDLSGNNHDFAQATEANQPHYHTNVLNGLPGVYFDGGDWLICNIDWPSLYTLFAVAQSNVNAYQSIIDGDHNSGVRVFQFRYNETGTEGQFIAWPGPATDTSDSFTTGNSYVFSGVRAESSVEMWVNGTSGGGTVIGAGLGVVGAKPIWLGAYSSFAGQLTGYIHEAIAYDSALSDTERQAIEAYLMAKWGIP